MGRYRNIGTGAVIESAAQIKGGDWREIEPAVTPPASVQEKRRPQGGKKDGRSIRNNR